MDEVRQKLINLFKKEFKNSSELQQKYKAELILKGLMTKNELSFNSSRDEWDNAYKRFLKDIK